MKKILCIILMGLLLFVGGCTKEYSLFQISSTPTINVSVGDKIENIVSLDSEFISLINGDYIATSKGQAIVETTEGERLVIVSNDVKSIDVNTKQRLALNEQTTIETIVNPITASQEVNYQVIDENILNVDEKGNVLAVGYGMTSIVVSSKENPNVKKEISILVLDNDEEYYEKQIECLLNEQVEQLDISNLNGLFKPLVEKVSNSTIQINAYQTSNNSLSQETGSGVIYKCDLVLQNGEVIENVLDAWKYSSIAKFKYYVVTNRHIVEESQEITVQLNDDLEVSCQILEYDDKVDLAVISFESLYYYPVIEYGNSDEIQIGEFVLCVGYGNSQYPNLSIKFGIISYDHRYISIDTDGDNVSDWDSSYIQHDIGVSDADSGGALINLRGEVIGINTTKISSLSIDKMSFAIPSNLVVQVSTSLEQGIRPQRPSLGVTVLDVKRYYENVEYYQVQYPNINMPETATYGMYITEINKGSLAEKCDLQIDDILIKINNLPIYKTYVLRYELSNYVIGSGEEIILTILRKGVEVEISLIL